MISRTKKIERRFTHRRDGEVLSQRFMAGHPGGSFARLILVKILRKQVRNRSETVLALFRSCFGVLERFLRYFWTALERFQNCSCLTRWQKK